MSDKSELYWLAHDLRARLEWYQRSGAYAVPAGKMHREGAPEDQETSASSVEGALAPSARPTLPQVRELLGDCQRCKLATSRQQIVFGSGSETAPLMFIGEAPGAEEDRRGEPFVGRAGQLLDRMIAAMGWGRDDVYIANVLKCRPPGNRDPEADEVEQCERFLDRQIEAIGPRVIVTLGKPAAHLLLKTRAPISALRGAFKDYRGVRVMPTFHPAYLLREPARKREAWSDLQKVMGELERLGVTPPHPTKG